jgi:hypothetical protein
MAGAMLVVEALPVIKGFRPHSSARKSHFSADISSNQDALKYATFCNPKRLENIHQPREPSF